MPDYRNVVKLCLQYSSAQPDRLLAVSGQKRLTNGHLLFRLSTLHRENELRVVANASDEDNWQGRELWF